MYIEFLDLSLAGLIIRLILGLLIGFCIGLTGVGGGVLGLQATTLILGMQPIAAVGTTSLYIFLTNISASFHHARLRNICWGPVVRMLTGAIPANILVANWISAKSDNRHFQHNLRIFIVGVVFFSVFFIILNMVRKSRRTQDTGRRGLMERINGHSILRILLGILMGIIVGALIGATSIGGGVLIVPILIIVFGLSASCTVGSSIFISMVLTLVTSIVYGRGGEVDKVTAITMAVGSLAGVYYGSRLSARLPEKLLQGVVIGLILIAAIVMLLHLLHDGVPHAA